MGLAKSMQIISSLPVISVQANNLSRFGPVDNRQGLPSRAALQPANLTLWSRLGNNNQGVSSPIELQAKFFGVE